jgi:NitT/TauT family transport system permease protein
VICATLVALFPIIANTTLGLRSVNPGLLSYFKLNRATRCRRCAAAHPSRRCPTSSAACASAAGLALIGAVVAEFVAGTGGTGTGLAYQILQAGYQLNIPRMFAALVLITAHRRAAVRADGRCCRKLGAGRLARSERSHA